MKLSAGIVLASGTASLASMRDHPPQHLQHLARFPDNAVFTHIGGTEDGNAAPLHARQAPVAGSGAGAGTAAGAGVDGAPAITSAAPAFQSTSFYAPLDISPSMPDLGYNPPSYPPSTATGGAGAPPSSVGPSGAGPTGGAPSYGGWGPKPSGGPPAGAPPSSGGPPQGPPSGAGGGPSGAGAQGPPAGSWSAPAPAEESCSTGTEVWGGHTYTTTATASPPGEPTGWGGSSPGGYSPPPPAQPTSWTTNSTIPAATSTWQTTAAPSKSAAPSPDNGSWDQGPGTAGGNKPGYQNAATTFSSTSVGALVSLCAVVLAAAFL